MFLYIYHHCLLIAGGNKLVDYSFSEDEDPVNGSFSLEEVCLKTVYTVTIPFPANFNFNIEELPSIENPSPQPNRDLQTPPSSAPTSPPTAPSSPGDLGPRTPRQCFTPSSGARRPPVDSSPFRRPSHTVGSPAPLTNEVTGPGGSGDMMIGALTHRYIFNV